MAERLLVVSSNDGKVREIEAMLGSPVERVDLDIPEIQALDVEAVVRQKALVAYERVGRAVVVEDTGLALDALGGLPGALVRWFLETLGPGGICGPSLLLCAACAAASEARACRGSRDRSPFPSALPWLAMRQHSSTPASTRAPMSRRRSRSGPSGVRSTAVS